MGAEAPYKAPMKFLSLLIFVLPLPCLAGSFWADPPQAIRGGTLVVGGSVIEMNALHRREA